MISMNPSLSPTVKPVSFRQQQQPKASQPAQNPLHFSGDAFKIYNALNPPTPSPDVRFKEIGDTIVWQKGEQTINVADMIAFLCRIRKANDYPGFGSIETLVKGFPGMDKTKLENAFKSLYHRENYLGFHSRSAHYWLRPNGLEILNKLYPAINLPPKEELFTSAQTVMREF
jgi:hypothetical protein